jgi:hypothetical protein
MKKARIVKNAFLSYLSALYRKINSLRIENSCPPWDAGGKNCENWHEICKIHS